MFGENHYVPILKWKRGEQKALEYVSNASKSNITPLIEIVPVPYDFVNEQPAKTIDQHLSSTGEQIANAWGLERPVFIDLYWVDPNERMNNGDHPLTHVINDAHAHNMNLIPVTGYNRDNAYQQAVKDAHIQDGNGICIRLEDDDFLDIATIINDLQNSLEITPESIDLIIDLKEISHSTLNANVIMITSVINSIPNINRYRTLTLCSSAFPATLSGITSGSIGSIARIEWDLWTLLHLRRALGRIPTFGDYAIANLLYSEINPRIMQMSANIRYTTTNEWLIFRGRSIKVHGWGQVRNLAHQITSHLNYSGATFSWGDQYIADCAANNGGTGNAETWRRVGTNHHIEFIIKQIANYTVILAGSSQTAATLS